MSAQPVSISAPSQTTLPSNDANRDFLALLPRIRRLARGRFHYLPPHEREEAIAEAVAAAFIKFSAAMACGESRWMKPRTLAKSAVAAVQAGRRGGEASNGTLDVMSRRVQRRHGFRCHSLDQRIDGRRDGNTTGSRWRDVLAVDRRILFGNGVCEFA